MCDTFVSREKVIESINVLKEYVNKYRGKDKTNGEHEKQTKQVKAKNLLEDEEMERIILQVDFKKIPVNRNTFINCIALGHHWRHECDLETCLFVNDIHKEPLSDREADVEETKSHYKDMLSASGVETLVNEMITIRQLRTEYSVFEAQEKLAKSFDLFLADKKLMNNKFNFLARFLGKRFWLEFKKVPNPVDFTLTGEKLKTQLEEKLNQTYMYVSGRGSTSSVMIGILKQTNEHLGDNLMTVLKKINELYGINVRSLKLKTRKSIGITFYLDCGLSSEVDIIRNKSKPVPVIDDFSLGIDEEIAVYPNGTVKILDKTTNDKSGKRKKGLEKGNKKRSGNPKMANKKKKLAKIDA